MTVNAFSPAEKQHLYNAYQLNVRERGLSQTNNLFHYAGHDYSVVLMINRIQIYVIETDPFDRFMLHGASPSRHSETAIGGELAELFQNPHHWRITLNNQKLFREKSTSPTFFNLKNGGIHCNQFTRDNK